MTFDEWWDTTKAESMPDTYKGWENSCRQAWAEAGKHAEELRQAVRALAALNAWHHFGECRAFGPDPILAPHEADELARRVLRA